jgi:hypothetical protein
VGVLIRHLPAGCALVRALNGGDVPFTRLEHLTADVWALWAKQDHPVRAEMEAKARTAAKLARVIQLRTKFEQRKRAYGLG